ncbi:hypothetical protein [Formosa maritima]|uniref:Uncharacterized protein n=1 Tax=Formosa maritima TaxID=2592046 RepID=A0A5D0GME8_9FLAO|nr:hypothetical protein [Formosa maritima]TYA60063.1 hypothetical protein FVF61_00120 [Formosa maritima]
MKLLRTIIPLFFVSIIIYSCTEENDSNLNSDMSKSNSTLKESYNLGLLEYYNNDLSMVEFGELHNIGLNNFQSNQPNYLYSDFNSLISEISLELNKTNPNTFKRLVNTYEIDDTLLNNNITFETFILDQVNKLHSINVRELITEIVVNKLNFNDASILANEYLTKRNLKQSEIDEINLFISVAGHSNEFWSSYYGIYINGSNNRYPCDPKDQVYLADAFGFLCWGGLGGIGYSWFVDEAQDQNGGGCL